MKNAKPWTAETGVANMSLRKKADGVLAEAKTLAMRVNSWADFSLELFGQDSGLITRTFPDEMERQVFFDSEQYQEVNDILVGLMKRLGVADGATPRREKSGRFNVRVPRTLHQSLGIEAKREGVSLNQLVVSKLSISLRHSGNLDLALVAQAFAEIHDGYAVDRIVVDPDYNGKFLRRCRQLGLPQSDFQLNHAIFNIRKSKKGRDQLGIVIPATTRKTEFRDFDGYQFASEIAVRVLQRTEGATLDRILCDPSLAKTFDGIAMKLANETVLKLRWAALNLRKTHRLRPISEEVTEYDLVSTGPVKSIDLSSLSDLPGLYAFYDETRPIYAGETERLRRRIGLHLEYGMPCVKIKEDEGLVLRTLVLPSANQTERVRWLMDFVNRERPLLNYQKVA